MATQPVQTTEVPERKQSIFGKYINLNKRDFHKRVFVNRSLNLDKIHFYGFDMDYTLAVYKSPQYEAMSFKLFVERLVQVGYPEAITEYEYDSTFAIRGLWFDTLYGNMLKVDSFGNILVCIRGFTFLKPSEIQEIYPNKFLQLDEVRVHVANTLYNLPESYLLACLIDYFSNSNGYTNTATGVVCGDLAMSYQSIFQDVKKAVEYVHQAGELKEKTCQNLKNLLEHNGSKLKLLMQRMRSQGAKTFLLTNSDYKYTRSVMTYLLGTLWMQHFDYVIVDAGKPVFFSEGTILRQIDQSTGRRRIGNYTGALLSNNVYSGGSCEVLSKLIGAKGREVLYCGDHIFGDILKSKKTQGWRTLLVVPELVHELHVWTHEHELFSQMVDLETQLSELYRNLDSSTTEKPDGAALHAALRQTAHQVDMSYGKLGSVFRSGSRQTFFASQVARYADLYTSSVTNLLHYPLFYMFKSPIILMPHEGTVDPAAAALDVDDVCAGNQADGQCQRLQSALVPHLWAEAPTSVTNHHDDDESGSDEECESGHAL